MIDWNELNSLKEKGYLFRGEPQFYKKVTSRLYRNTPFKELRIAHLPRIEENLIKECLSHYYNQGYIDAIENDMTLQKLVLHKLSEIQHFGGSTNLIDFTICPYRALFFACENLRNEGSLIAIHPGSIPSLNYIKQSGENILIPWSNYEYILRDTKHLLAGYLLEKVRAQKGIFIHCKNGILNLDYKKIRIAARWKSDIMEKLLNDHEINQQKLYPGIIGFVDSHETFKFPINS